MAASQLFLQNSCCVASKQCVAEHQQPDATAHEHSHAAPHPNPTPNRLRSKQCVSTSAPPHAVAGRQSQPWQTPTVYVP